MTKVNAQNWGQLDFLINNFYEIVEYKRGRGVYGDRVILKRQKNAPAVFAGGDKLFEFYYLDANAVKELPRTILEKIKIITRFVCSPESMNILCEFDQSNSIEPSEWALQTKAEMINAKTIDFNILNNILMERYKLLDSNFLSKLKKHREKQYFLASCEEYKFITKDYADAQVNKL